MDKSYAVLGAGMQGTAVAYDLAKFGDAACIRMGDISFDHAKTNSWRVNDLIGSAICEPAEVNALDPDNLAKFLANVDVVVSCVPYWMHPKIAAVAINVGTSMVDLGGNTEITMETLSLDSQAKAAEVTIVPDTGLAPGLVNSIGSYFIEQFDTVESVKLYCGVLPQHPKPPFNYKLTFNIEGLVTEYDFHAVALRNGEIVLIDTLSEVETLHVDQLGEMEAFTTSGGTSTAPYTWHGQVSNYEYKTIRFPGHCERMRIFKDFGFWSTDEISVDGCKVQPRKVFYKVFGDALAQIEDTDQCVVRGVGVGTKDGQPVRRQVDIFDKQDEVTGFTSMERLTGFSSAIYAIEIAHERMEAGCLRYETAMSGTEFLKQIERRGIHLAYS